MKIATRYKGDAYVSVEAVEHCTGGCAAPGDICRLDVCSYKGAPLVHHIGPHIWNLLGPAGSLETEVLVLAEGKIYRTGRFETGECQRCDWNSGDPVEAIARDKEEEPYAVYWGNSSMVRREYLRRYAYE